MVLVERHEVHRRHFGPSLVSERALWERGGEGRDVADECEVEVESLLGAWAARSRGVNGAVGALCCRTRKTKTSKTMHAMKET